MKKQFGFTLIELLVILGIIGALIFIVFVNVNGASASCGGWFEPSCDDTSNLQQNEQEKVSINQYKMETVTPIPSLEKSLERENIKKRLELWNNDNKESYIYLISFGRVMAFYVVKGKITSGNKRLTSTERFVGGKDCGDSYCDMLIESPELDGTYGSSNPYIYFWTTDGAYVQWNGEYMLSDQPLKLSTQPELIRTIK